MQDPDCSESHLSWVGAPSPIAINMIPWHLRHLRVNCVYLKNAPTSLFWSIASCILYRTSTPHPTFGGWWCHQPSNVLIQARHCGTKLLQLVCQLKLRSLGGCRGFIRFNLPGLMYSIPASAYASHILLIYCWYLFMKNSSSLNICFNAKLPQLLPQI